MYSFSLTQVAHRQFNGSIKKWLRNTFLVNKPPLPLPQCYRSNDGTALCNGSCTLVEVFVSLPVVLILESLDAENDPLWDFPITVAPSANKTLTSDGVIYDLVGRIFYSKKYAHFIVRYRDNAGGPGVYLYDGKVHGGHSMHEKGAKLDTHLSGTDIDHPDEYTTHAVIYHLRGGSTAQSRFYQDQLSAAARLHHLAFSSTDLDVLPEISDSRLGHSMIRMADVDRFWMINPYYRKTADYVPSGLHSLPEDSKRLATPIDPKDDHAASANEAVADTEGGSLHSIHKEELPLISPASPSLSDSGLVIFPFECRCGAVGDNGEDLSNGEPVIQCDRCLNWSHIACQMDGRASKLPLKSRFVCDLHYFATRPKG